MAKRFGVTEPRLWTRPLRELTTETSLGFEVIDFALLVLGVELRPWQKWLLIHALELNEDGTYRFQRVIVLVARQNGKTMLSSVLAAWWLFIDSERFPDRLPPVKFKVVGIAQSMDIAREPWGAVKTWANPAPDTTELADLALPVLQDATAKVVDAHGQEGIFAKSRAHYELRAAKNVRGKPAPRLIFDELREQRTWVAWNAASHVFKSFGTLGQLWCFSNAGDPGAVVLKAQRDKCLKLIDSWAASVESGVSSAAVWASQNETTLGLFEWSAPDECDLDDIGAVRQANPSVGYGEFTVADVLAARPPGSPEADYRTEALCQWIDARVYPHIEPEAWRMLSDPDSVIADGSALVLGVDVSADRKWSYMAVAGWREDGLKHVELVAGRPGVRWMRDAARELRETWGVQHVALQVRGAPVSEFAKDFEEAGLEVVEVGGSALGAVTGGIHDAVRDRRVYHPDCAASLMSFGGAVVRDIGDGLIAWDRRKSGTDAAPAVAISSALWALDHLPEPDEPPPPALVGVLDLSEPSPVVGGGNLFNVQF